MTDMVIRGNVRYRPRDARRAADDPDLKVVHPSVTKVRTPDTAKRRKRRGDRDSE